jgi:hypothetical protein
VAKTCQPGSTGNNESNGITHKEVANQTKSKGKTL